MPSSLSARKNMAALSVIIVAAGTSQRMGFDKLSEPLAGKMVLAWSIEAFLSLPDVLEIIVACPERLWQALGSLTQHELLRRVDGGATRQESVACGLNLARGTWAAVHDGARPLIQPNDIQRCFNQAMATGAAALASRITATLKRADNASFVRESIDRDGVWAMETPQIALTENLRQAYQLVADEQHIITDEVSALQLANFPTKLLESTFPNIKITSPSDLAMAKALVASLQS